jgi:hypothetical protein
MGLAVMRSLDTPRRLAATQELEDCQQELAGQYLLAAVGAGMGGKAVGDVRGRAEELPVEPGRVK